MKTATKSKSKSTTNQHQERLDEMNEKIDLLLKKVHDMQVELDKLNAQHKPLIN